MGALVTGLAPADLAAVETALAETDLLLARNYPGEQQDRQPVHTLYVPADRFEPDLAARLGVEALDLVEAQGGMLRVCEIVGLSAELSAAVAPRVEAKLRSEPIEDLRLDFEDGYGVRPEGEEDAEARILAKSIADAVANGTAPPFIGIRFKCFEANVRQQALRTLDIFIASLIEFGGLPKGLVLTLPKVTTVAQVEVMAGVCRALEAAHGLSEGRLRFEVQVETPQLIVGADGTMPVAALLHRAEGRISALHYGTYDYSASLQIAAAYQSMEHPAADFAKQVMQVAVAGTGVRLSDGSTNIIPLGDDDSIREAWRLHTRLVQRSLRNGYYQGWDLHAAQLPTRYIATYAFYREGFDAAAKRLHNYLHGGVGGVLDEPATARALSRFIERGVSCGAIDSHEVRDRIGFDAAELGSRVVGPAVCAVEDGAVEDGAAEDGAAEIGAVEIGTDEVCAAE